ncbi:YerC/YecD family TrpR-related protein [Sphingomicrobium sp. XHP0239]|uniref:YerC/YecD family TrpR-related protein n=1 Tax=Sphingomicrobium maritimum TaxID=3133972 RepID=UPI0031CCD7DE
MMDTAEIRELDARESLAESIGRLAVALASLDRAEEIAALLDDLTTPAELTAMAERWHVARLLADGSLTYRQIHDVTGVSTTTITRVARFLKGGDAGGYRLTLERLNNGKTPS